MGSRPQVAEPVGLFRMLGAPIVAFSGILLVLLAIPDRVMMPASDGSYTPLVLLFIEAIKRPILPAGWTIVEPGGLSEPLEIYVVASITLALLVSSPIFSYQILSSIAPALAIRKRALSSLVALASVLLAAGALFGAFFLTPFYIHSTTPFFDVTGLAPLLDAASFYFLVFRVMCVTTVEFTLPVYIYALIRFRSSRQQ
jgi:Sec-independent protein secretion pathway component TatC